MPLPPLVLLLLPALLPPIPLPVVAPDEEPAPELPVPAPLRGLLPLFPLPDIPLDGPQSTFDLASDSLLPLPLRPELFPAIPELAPELLLPELDPDVPLFSEPDEAILLSGQSDVEPSELLEPLRPDELPVLPVELEDPDLPVSIPCELLPLDELPLVCDQPGCKQNASVLERANAVSMVFLFFMRFLPPSNCCESPDVALDRQQ